jgi:UDP-xylose:glucoside alpha-1,3-xylosyltransferase
MIGVNSKIMKTFVIIVLVALLTVFQIESEVFSMKKKVTFKHKNLQETVIAIVGCGEERIAEALNVVKSALMFSKDTDELKFIIFSDFEYHKSIKKSLKVFQSHRPFNFQIVNASFPEKGYEVWRNLFAACSTQRLFFPDLLPDVDALLYVDTDTLFLSPPSETFQLFAKYTELQVAGLVANSLDGGFYPKKSKIPFYGEFALNAGVKMMNLTRMREIEYQKMLIDIFWKYRDNITYADQDLINIYFKFHPQRLYEMPCDFNFRSEFCLRNKTCDGLKILHGNRRNLNFQGTVFNDILNFVINVSGNVEASAEN